MKHFILSLLLLSGVVAKAQGKWPTEQRGDTTFTFITNQNVLERLRVKYTWDSFDAGFARDTMMYSFFRFEDKGIVIGVPYHTNCAVIEYPAENHELKYPALIKTEWYRKRREREERRKRRR